MSEIKQGIFVNRAGRVCVATPYGVVEYGLRPDEMRAFASALNNAANAMEADAGKAASAAIKRAGGLQ